MKFVFAFVALIGISVALPAPEAPELVLTRSEKRDEFNQFGLSYTGNGLAVAQQGALKAIDTPNGKENVLVQQGSYAFIGGDGKEYRLSYIADENGFQPTADFLPTPPPIPPVPIVALPTPPSVPAIAL